MDSSVDLARVAAMFEIKGVFCLETKGNSKKPVIFLNSRHKKVILSVYKTLQIYDIKMDLIQRETYLTLRITYKKNCIKFYKLINNYIINKPKNYSLVMKWSM